MIVKNEAHVIRRCLESIRPIIDCWVIVDTGSSDGTQDLICAYLNDLPGELVERPWVNFAHNRTEALARARLRATYTIMIDADEVLELDDDFHLPELLADAYNLQVVYDGYTYHRKQLVNSAFPWRYVGVLHEYVYCDEAKSEGRLEGVRTIVHHDGARAHDPNTYRRDAQTLEDALLEEPSNARYVFYLAQSYRDAGDVDAALSRYRERSGMGGWADEIWYSLYQIALLEERGGVAWPTVMQSYLAAFQFDPGRAGSLYRIGLHYQASREYNLSHLFFAKAMSIPSPGGDRLFVEHTVYDYLLPLEYAVACFYVGNHDEAIGINDALLNGGKLPPSLVGRVTENRRFSLDAVSIQRP